MNDASVSSVWELFLFVLCTHYVLNNNNKSARISRSWVNKNLNLDKNMNYIIGIKTVYE